MIIYKVENKINGKIYIGMTMKSVGQRISMHIKNNKSYFQKALNKYGIQSFSIDVIDCADDRETLGDKEMYWINFYNSRYPNGYNQTDGGDGGLTSFGFGSKHSKEDLEKMRNRVLSETHKQKLMGPKSVDHRRKLCDILTKSNKSRIGSKLSEATKEKLSKAKKGKPWTKARRDAENKRQGGLK